ncbi:MAG: electron transfer flavoprotein subunit alpha/FixB family protein [Deltaproteobacteria bacterium]|jgi:electron transfer flavoprotein alpha subunit|nr:electron transfer flavoprotein subunit alpha/FixB family protein [Deltaproteobacteria bacterium]
MSKELWVIAEHTEGRLRKVSHMALGVGRAVAGRFGLTCCAVLLGDGAEPLIRELAACGTEKIYVADDSSLSGHNYEACTAAVSALAVGGKPAVIFMGHNSLGKNMAPRLAQRLGVGLVSDCVEIDNGEDGLLFKRPVYSGKAFAWIRLTGRPAIATLRPNAFTGAAGAPVRPEVARHKTLLAAVRMRSLVRELAARAGTRPALAEADIVVSGGRGMKSAANFALIEELADTIGAAVGASRAVVDAGWRNYGDQVGQTGKVISPSLYFAFGISGALQHIAGMSSSKVIIAVDKNPEANIFKIADYGIVADALEVLPVLTAEFKRLRG